MAAAGSVPEPATMMHGRNGRGRGNSNRKTHFVGRKLSAFFIPYGEMNIFNYFEMK